MAQKDKPMVQQALHKGLFITRPRSLPDEELNTGSNPNIVDNSNNQQWITVSNKKRPLASPENKENQNKQSKLDSYWLSQPIDLTNSFSGLEEEKDESPSGNQPSYQKLSRPPPIFIDKVGNIKPLIKLLDEHAQDNYTVKILRNDRVKIQPTISEAYTNIVKQLEIKETEFYTYKPKQERSYKVILKKIHPSTCIDDIKEALAERGHTTTNIWNIKDRMTKRPLPIFVIELQANNNNKDIYNIKDLLHCCVVFEEPRPKREIPQCANCQEYGHTKKYCRRRPKCIKCAQNHPSAECPVKGRLDSVKCALCEGNHPANYKGCQVYKDLQKSKFPSLRKKTLSEKVTQPITDKTPTVKQVTAEPKMPYHTKTNTVPTYAKVATGFAEPQPIHKEPNQTHNISHPVELTEMLIMMQQIMQQLSTMTNLLLQMMSNQQHSNN